MSVPRPVGEFLTELQQTAVQMHEIFEAYIEAGWARGEALYLIGSMMSGAMQKPPLPGPEDA